MKIKMHKVDNLVLQTEDILNALRSLDEILKSGNCNECSNKDCGYKPEAGKLIRFNCPFYQSKN